MKPVSLDELLEIIQKKKPREIHAGLIHGKYEVTLYVPVSERINESEFYYVESEEGQ